jgi:type 1 fimbriae regulatory protein FimB
MGLRKNVPTGILSRYFYGFCRRIWTGDAAASAQDMKSISTLKPVGYPHMLRHACGFALTDQGAGNTRLIQDYLGPRNVQHTVRYTATNPARLEKHWR